MFESASICQCFVNSKVHDIFSAFFMMVVIALIRISDKKDVPNRNVVASFDFKKIPDFIGTFV